MRISLSKRQLHQRNIKEYCQVHGILEGGDIDPDELTAWVINTKRAEPE